MKKIYFLFIIIPLLINAQETKIGLPRNGVKLLVFPEAVDFSVLGDKLNFVEVSLSESGSKYAPQILGLRISDELTDPGAVTNYSVMTRDGTLYDLSIFYDPAGDTKPVRLDETMSSFSLDKKKSRLKAGTKNLRSRDSILPRQHYYKNQSPSGEDSVSSNNSDEEKPLREELYELDKEEYIRRKCYYNQFKKGSIVDKPAREGNVLLWLKEVYYNHNELYFLFRIDNEETIDYDVKVLRTSLGTNFKRDADNQKINFPPDYKYKVPTRIKGKTSNYFFLVYDKFTLDKNKDLVVQLDEINGNRNLTLRINRSKVNRPRRF
ncbi:MAG: DUF4138 domain-containing protein [Bacteroidota bacterium]